MEKIIITIQLVLTLLNVACAFWQINLKNYKTALFSAFAAGSGSMSLLYLLTH